MLEGLSLTLGHIRDRLAKPATIASFGPGGEALCEIEGTWSDDHGIGIKGWVLGRKEAVESAEFTVGDTTVAVAQWARRKDVAMVHPLYWGNGDCGFIVHIPCAAEHEVKVNIKVGGQNLSNTIRLKAPVQEKLDAAGGKLFKEFINAVNRGHLSVLEIGSRVVSPGSKSKRPLFHGASSYTGFDIYPDGNTDVVGDAHRLSGYFDGRRFDAVFSVSVFEHLAMPWVAAREINKVLNVGGLTFHATHFAWPLHEKPWDFWRFSDEGLKALFSPMAGFEAVDAELYSPIRLHVDNMLPGQEELPFQPAFGGSAVLAKKEQELGECRLSRDWAPDKVLGKHSHYPKP